MTRQVVLVGGGTAAAAAAMTLRREGFDGDVTIIGDEPTLPYERPPLSKGLLAGEQSLDDATIQPRAWFEDNEVEVVAGCRVTRLTPATRTVELDDGHCFRADAVLLATGGRPHRIEGLDGPRVYYLRTVDDARRLSERLGQGQRLVLVGMGFIGAEVAATARARGTAVTAIERLPVPLQHALGETVGRALTAMHTDHGVRVLGGTSVADLESTRDAAVLTTTTGERIEADAVLVGVGMTPNVELAADAGLVVDDGIVVDESCRTSVPGVFAAGDVARHYHPSSGRYLRVEHHDNALQQGAAAARSIVGDSTPYDPVHWFWSDQYDHTIQWAGTPGPWDLEVVRGDLDGCDATVLYLLEGRLRAAVALDRPRELRAARHLIAQGATPAPAALTDPDSDLRSLLP